jgi:hypothetical protein
MYVQKQVEEVEVIAGVEVEAEKEIEMFLVISIKIEKDIIEIKIRILILTTIVDTEIITNTIPAGVIIIIIKINSTLIKEIEVPLV